MLEEVQGVFYVDVSKCPPDHWPYWFQQAALKNGTLSPDVKLIPKPKPETPTEDPK